MGLRSRIRARLRDPLKRTLTPLASTLVRRDGQALDTWGLERDDAGSLQLRSIALEPLLERFGSPLHVVDAQKLLENARDFLFVPPGAQAGVECYYSYKTNPVPGVLSRLHAAGIGAEVISEYELWLAQRLGLDGSRIVLNGPARSGAAMQSAIELGALWQVNAREEIQELADRARAIGKRARVGLRVAPVGSWGGQFGEPVEEGGALSVYEELLSHAELDVVAVHAHLGGEISTAEHVEGLVAGVLDLADAVRARFDHTLSIVDLGGSLACPTVSSYSPRALRLNQFLSVDLPSREPSSVLSIRDYVTAAVTAVEAQCQTRRFPRPRIFVEPGRSLTGNTQMLLTRVLGLKASGAIGLTFAIMDAGINVAEPVRSEYHEFVTLAQPRALERSYRVVGPICTPMDTLCWARRLPELEPGDALGIMDSGAYFMPFSTSFSFPKPGIAVIEDGEATVLRRAETFEDLISRDEPW